MMSMEQSRLDLCQLGLEMFKICEDQLKNTREAFFSLDKDLTEKVIYTEKRVNALDLEIDRDCERFLALYYPVAKDLRFTLGLRKINFGLERLGDYCFEISKFIVEINELPAKELRHLRVDEMFPLSLSMLQVVKVAFGEVDSARAREIFNKEQTSMRFKRKLFQKFVRRLKRTLLLLITTSCCSL